jgi:hypothetical protein
VGQLRGDDTVEHIDAAVNALQNVDGGAHTHEIARELLRQAFGDERGHIVPLEMSFAYCQASDSQSVKREAA